jgi:hypothetical protein
MKHLLKIEKFIDNVLNEALNLNLAKKYTAMGANRSKVVIDKLNKIMGNKQRVYLPVVEEVESIAQNEIGWFLSSIGYTISDYIQGIAFQNENEKRQVRIGKLLSQHKKPELLQKFNMDPIRQLAKQGSKTEYSVVVSQHPYDVAGMSAGTGREAWHSSCLNAVGGGNNRYLPGEIKNGTLVAYLIKSDDTNIQKPLGRVNVKPYCDTPGCSPSKYWFPDTRLYGSFSPAALKVLKDWIISWQGIQEGEFFKTDGCYNYAGTAYVISVSEDNGSFEVNDEYDDHQDYNGEDDEYDDEAEMDYDIDWFVDNNRTFAQLSHYIMASGGTTELNVDDWSNDQDDIEYIEFIMPSFVLIDPQDVTAPYYSLRSRGFEYTRLSNISYGSIKEINGDISVDYNYFLRGQGVGAERVDPKGYVYHCFQKMIEDNNVDINGSFIEFKNFPDLRGVTDNREGLFMDFGNVELNAYNMVFNFVDCEKGFVLATLNNLANHYIYHYTNEHEDSFKRITIEYTDSFKGEYFSVNGEDDLSEFFKTRLLLSAISVEEDRQGQMKAPILKFIGFDFSKSIEYLKSETSDRSWFIENGLSDFLVDANTHVSVDDSKWFLEAKKDIFEGFKNVTGKEYVFTLNHDNYVIPFTKLKEKGLKIPEGVISTLHLEQVSFDELLPFVEILPKDIRNMVITNCSGYKLIEFLSHFKNSIRGLLLTRMTLGSQNDLTNLPRALKYLCLVNLSVRDREGYSRIDKNVALSLLSKISPEYRGYYLETIANPNIDLLSSHTQQIPMVCLDELYDNLQYSGPRKLMENILGNEFCVIFSQYDRSEFQKIKLKKVNFNGNETCEVVIDYDSTKGNSTLYHIPVKLSERFMESNPRLQAINNLAFPYKIDDYLGSCIINYYNPSIRPVTSFKNYPNVITGNLEIKESGRGNNPTLGTTHWKDPNFLKDFPKYVRDHIIFTTVSYDERIDKLSEEQENDNIQILANHLGLSFEETMEKVVFNNLKS